MSALLRADSVTYGHLSATRRHRASPAELVATPALTDGPGVHQVTLAVETGAIVGLLGPNGSGKTTLLRLLAGTLIPERGQVRLDDVNLSSLSRRQVARRIAVVPQETHLAFDYTVLEVALMGRFPHLGAFELEGPRDVAVVRDGLEATGTLDLEHRQFSTLSGGEKQRVVIASALAQAADIMLLDEPTASLDLGYQIEVAALLARLNRERGLTLVVATHDLNFAASLCRQLVLLREGRVIANGPTADVLTSDRIAALYGVTAEVQFNQAAGHLTVVPLRKSSAGDSTVHAQH